MESKTLTNKFFRATPTVAPAGLHRLISMAMHHAQRSMAPLLVAASILVVWQLSVVYFGISEVVLPAPLSIGRSILNVAPMLAKHAVPTTFDVVLGFGLAASLGILIASALAASEGIRRAVYPSILFFQLIPKIALAPLFILWFGIGSGSRLAYILFISFFPVVLATLSGLLATPPEMIRLCRACSARAIDVFLYVRFPYAVPMIFSGLKISVTFAIVGVVVGEFISAQAGLGYLILFASSQSDTPLAMAAITVICGIGLLLYGAVCAAEFFVLRRLGENKQRS